jgi:hypothetical protein
MAKMKTLPNVSLHGTKDRLGVEDDKVSLASYEGGLGDSKMKPEVPLSKEKLKYLRYFRLVTHRKRNGKALSKLDTVLPRQIAPPR